MESYNNNNNNSYNTNSDEYEYNKEASDSFADGDREEYENDIIIHHSVRSCKRNSVLSISSWSMANSIDNDAFFLEPINSSSSAASNILNNSNNNDHQRRNSDSSVSSPAQIQPQSSQLLVDSHDSPTCVMDATRIFDGDDDAATTSCRSRSTSTGGNSCSRIKGGSKRFSNNLPHFPEDLDDDDDSCCDGNDNVVDEDDDDIDDDATPFQWLNNNDTDDDIDSAYCNDDDDDDEQQQQTTSNSSSNNNRNNLLVLTSPTTNAAASNAVVSQEDNEENIFIKLINFWKNLPVTCCLPSSSARIQIKKADDVSTTRLSSITPLPDNHLRPCHRRCHRRSQTDPTLLSEVTKNIVFSKNKIDAPPPPPMRSPNTNNNNNNSANSDDHKQQASSNCNTDNDKNNRRRSSFIKNTKNIRRSSHITKYEIGEFIEFDPTIMDDFGYDDLDDDDAISLPEELM